MLPREGRGVGPPGLDTSEGGKPRSKQSIRDRILVGFLEEGRSDLGLKRRVNFTTQKSGEGLKEFPQA